MIRSSWLFPVLLVAVTASCSEPSSNEGTGNDAGSGGSNGSGGSTASGGSAGSVSSGGSAGSTASGGSIGSGGSTGSGGSGGQVNTVTCTFDVTPTISPNIPTVGIVEWSSSLPNVTQAYVEFGLDTNYGMQAPVDLNEANYRTLLLGMKASREYHLRVVAVSGSDQCVSDDFTIQTGPLATGLPRIDVSTPTGPTAGGFMITGTYQSGPAYILDADGDYVWWYNTGEVTRARMSYDGKHMWIAKGNVPSGQAKMVRVAMDGSNPEDLSSEFVGLNHDFTVLADETVVYIAYDNGCDKIVERSPDGTSRTIINSGMAFGGSTMCHCNSIQYSPKDDTIVFSELDHDAYVKVTRDGDIVWVLGGAFSDFTGDGASWDNQHGLHILDVDRLLIFNNGPMGQGAGSRAIEISLDLQSMTATRVWEYFAQPAISNIIMGDVQRLHNGNTLVTYSTQGVVHEVNADKQVVQTLEWQLGGAIGYVNKRQSLYGPPPN